MIARVFATFSILIYAVLVPILELNDTHLFNPEWPAHARVHEAWQLISNSALGLFSLWQLWVVRNTKLAASISLLIMGGFLLAYATMGLYDGSMAVSATRAAKEIFGLNLGLFGALLSFGCALIAFFLESRSTRSFGLHQSKNI
jgi:hypothetical protein